jgi:hypothetical protein
MGGEKGKAIFSRECPAPHGIAAGDRIAEGGTGVNDHGG